MQTATVIEEAPDFYIRSDPQNSVVEAWTTWSLPYDRLTPIQQRYRLGLRSALKTLRAASGVRATYTSNNASPNVDVENVLFYNVGAAAFRQIATRRLRFERIHASPPAPPEPLTFQPRHYVRYQNQVADETVNAVPGVQLAYCPSVALAKMGDSRDKAKMARLWSTFKRGMVITSGATWSLGQPLTVALRISAPATWRPNLADIVKPLIDGFISALHHYEGNQLNDVVSRIAALLGCPLQDVHTLLLNDQHALLGPRAVPHLRGEGLQWSPADHLVVAGEIVRDVCADHIPVTVQGSLMSAER